MNMSPNLINKNCGVFEQVSLQNLSQHNHHVQSGEVAHPDCVVSDRDGGGAGSVLLPPV